jgi:hypothetical protein
MIDPFESTSRLLSDIASGYRKQGNQRKDREADEKRYQDQLSRQNLLEQRQTTRYNDEIARQKRLDKRQTDMYNAKLAGEQAERAALSNLSMFDRKSAANAAIDNDIELKTILEQGRAEGAKTLANNFFINQINNSNELKAIRGMFGDDGEDFSPTQADLPEDPLAAIQDYYKNGEISKEDYTSFNEQLANFNKEFDNYVVSNKPVYRENENIRIYNDLLSKGVSPQVASTTADKLSMGYESTANLTKLAVAAQKAQQTQANKLADISFKVWNANKSKENKFGDKKTSELDVSNYIAEEIDAGPLDDITLLNMYKDAVNAGVNPSIAKNSLKDFVSVGFFKSPKGSSDAFTSFAKGIQKLENSNGELTREELVDSFMPEVVAAPDYVNINRAAFTGGLRDLMPQALGFPIRVPTTSGSTDSGSSTVDASLPTPKNREAVLTPAEITKTRQEAVQQGKNPDTAVVNALELKQILSNVKPTKPNNLTTLSDLSIRPNSDRDALANLYEFANVAGSTDLSVKENIDALNMTYGTEQPLTKDRIEKIVADVQSGNIDPVFADGSRYELTLPTEEEQALVLSTPIMNVYGGRKAFNGFMGLYNGFKNPAAISSFIGGLRAKLNTASRNRAFNRTGAKGGNTYGPPTPAQAAARTARQQEATFEIPALVRRTSNASPIVGPPTRAQSLASGNIR